MKICIFTLGCRVNSYESDAIKSELHKLGHEVYSDGLVDAELYILNTCAVTGEAERKSVQCISRIKKVNKNAKIIVCGCASQHSPQRFQKDGVIYISGTGNKLDLVRNLEKQGKSDFLEEKEYVECIANGQKAKEYVKVQDGCNNFCSYCIIPYLRGRSRSRKIENAVNEINNCKASEVVLTGINLSAFGKERGESLTDLIKAIEHTDKRISLGSISVSLIDREFLSALKKLKNFCPHFHISLQSGSNKVLKDMNRKYTREEYLDKVNLIKEYFCSPSITTDIIVGYPTETESDFEDTLDLIQSCKMSDLHIFPYSMREGTKAFNLGQLDGTVVSKRVERITILRDKLQKEYINSQIGNECEVLIEEKIGEYFVGYTDRYIRAYVKGEYNQGDIAKLKIKGKYKDGVIAE